MLEGFDPITSKEETDKIIASLKEENAMLRLKLDEAL
jgi:hypothetical protein